MPSSQEIGPFTRVRETNEEVYNKYAEEYYRCSRIYRRFEIQGKEYTPEARKYWDRMNQIGNMYSGSEPFVREGVDYLAKGMIGEVSLYRRFDLWIDESIALNPPQEEQVE